MTTVTIVTTALTMALVGVAIYTDVRWSKIFNRLTMPAIVAGLVINALAGLPGLTQGGGVDWAASLHGLLHSLGGLAVGLALFLLSCFLGRILGGGDIKLLMAIGALQGPLFVVWTIFYTAIIGGILAIAIALRHRILWEKLKTLFTSCYLRLTCKVPMEINEQETAQPRLPYAIPIGLGTIIALGALYVV